MTILGWYDDAVFKMDIIGFFFMVLVKPGMSNSFKATKHIQYSSVKWAVPKKTQPSHQLLLAVLIYWLLTPELDIITAWFNFLIKN